MSRTLFTEQEVRLATERRVKYIGAAKVSIDQIQFKTPLPRDLDPKNLDRLRNVFRKNRCRRLDLNNHVPVLVSQQDLTDALRKANLTDQSLLTNDAHQLPRLIFTNGQLQGLHGRHRLQVGAEVLPPADRWWVVDLYMNDIGEELRTSLVEEYANEKKPTDGEVYRKIRQYEGDYNEAFRERWLVRLSRSNQEKLNQLDNSRNRHLRRGFDKLLNIPGLWPGGMRISVLHRLIASSCVEVSDREVLAYLEYIWDFWSTLVSSDTISMKKIDQDTVECLQLLAPGKCHSDAKTACGFVLSGQAFARFNEDERRIIWSRMQNFDGLIPSLYTFFEDFKYLESCAHCIKRLFGPSSSSIRETMSSMFIPCLEEGLLGSEAADCIIQTSESTFRRQRATDMERLETAYLQVWLYTMRHYPLMPPDPKKDGGLLAKAARAKADERAIYEMAELARQLGFRSKEIDAIIDSSPDHEIARAALLQARKPSKYRYSEQQFDSLVSRIVGCFAEAIPDQPDDLPHDLLADSAMTLQMRSGMPQIRTHEQDSRLLFIDIMNADVVAADTITSFYVRRCVYFAFFGKSARSNISNQPLEPDGQRMEDPAQSPLFVQEDGPPGMNFSAVPYGPSSETLQNGQQRQSTADQRPPRSRIRQETLRNRRKKKFRRRLLAPDHADERDRALMELDTPHAETSDQDMGDENNTSSEGHDLDTLPDERATSELMITPTIIRSGSFHAQADDNMSDCTRVSFEAISREASPVDTEITKGRGRDVSLQDQTRINSASRPSSAESGDENLSDSSQNTKGQGLGSLIAGLRRAQEEEDRLGEGSASESEWLDDELEVSGEPGQPSEPPDHLTPSEYSRKSSTLPPVPDKEPTDKQNEPIQWDLDHTAATANTAGLQPDSHSDGRSAPSEDNANLRVPTGDSQSQDSPNHGDTPSATEQAEQRPSQAAVEIQFWYFERGEWRRSDCLLVNPADTSPIERLAEKYLRKKYSLYDLHLQDLRPAQCYQAATHDGRNAIFMISKYEEEKLLAEGRLNKDRQLLTMASRALDQASHAPPERSVKPRKS